MAPPPLFLPTKNNNKSRKFKRNREKKVVNHSRPSEPRFQARFLSSEVTDEAVKALKHFVEAHGDLECDLTQRRSSEQSWKSIQKHKYFFKKSFNKWWYSTRITISLNRKSKKCQWSIYWSLRRIKITICRCRIIWTLNDERKTFANKKQIHRFSKHWDCSSILDECFHTENYPNNATIVAETHLMIDS